MHKFDTLLKQTYCTYNGPRDQFININSVLSIFILLLIWSGLVLWHINHCRLFNVKPIFIDINSSISNNSV